MGFMWFSVVFVMATYRVLRAARHKLHIYIYIYVCVCVCAPEYYWLSMVQVYMFCFLTKLSASTANNFLMNFPF
jgi:hypothetical protein